MSRANQIVLPHAPYHLVYSRYASNERLTTTSVYQHQRSDWRHTGLKAVKSPWQFRTLASVRVFGMPYPMCTPNK